MAPARSGLVDVGDTRLHCEVRGAGPPVVLVPGASGDGGYLQPLADALANEFTAVTYDRRGNSRSPRPHGWTRTSNEEQAKDLVDLIRALDLAPVVVLGSSAGAVVALYAVLEHASLFRGTLLHEPALLATLERPEEVQALMQPIIEQAVAGRLREAMEAFAGLVAGESLRHLPQPVVERMLDNGQVFFGIELGTFDSWRPDEEHLQMLSVPVQPLVGEETLPFFREMAAWIGARVGRRVVPVPGGHVGMVDRTREFAEVVRPLIRSMK